MMMQTYRQSVLEVSIDYGFSLLINVGGQLLVYGKHATTGRVTFLVLTILLSVYPRRLATRRLFNVLLIEGTHQPRWHSALEVVSDTVLGLCIAIASQVLVYGSAATMARVGGLTTLIYAVTMLRRYALRRVFARFDVWEERFRKLLPGSARQITRPPESHASPDNSTQGSQVDHPTLVP